MVGGELKAKTYNQTSLAKTSFLSLGLLLSGIFLGEEGRFAEERLKTGPLADYFAKFGEKQSANRQMAHFNYLLGLGYLGKGKTEEAKAEFEKALAFDPNHFHSQKQLSWLSLKKGKNF